MENDQAAERIRRIAELYKQFDNEYWAFVTQLHRAGRHLGITGPSHEQQAMAELTYVGELFRIGLRLVTAGATPLGEIYLDHIPDGASGARQRVGEVFLDESGKILDTPGGTVTGQIRDRDIAKHLLVTWLERWLKASAELKTL